MGSTLTTEQILAGLPDEDHVNTIGAILKLVITLPGISGTEIRDLKPAHINTLSPVLANMTRLGLVRREQIKRTGKSGAATYRYFINDLSLLPETWDNLFMHREPRTFVGPVRSVRRPRIQENTTVAEDPTSRTDSITGVAVNPALVAGRSGDNWAPPHQILVTSDPAIAPAPPKLVITTSTGRYSLTIPQARELFDQLKLVFT